MNDQVFNGIFFTAFITTVVGCIITLTKQAYRSKCKEVSFCCIKIVRDIDAEVKQDEKDDLEVQNSKATRELNSDSSKENN